MALRLIPATGQPLAALALLAGLCACATTASAPAVDAQPPGWRIVERTGEARYLPPESAAWVAATTGQPLAGGSEVATGTGGRLIVDAPGRHLSIGPNSRFVLPGEDTWLEQRAGWLRYRIAPAAQPFRISTRSLELEVSSGVVDVHVNHLTTEVTVKEGQVRVATPDGLRETQMLAGHSARAGAASGTALAVRLVPGGALQPIEPIVLPAIQPKPAPAATGAAAPSTPSASVLPAPPPSAPAVGAAAEPFSLPQPTTLGRGQPQPLAGAPAAQAALEHDAGPARPATQVAGHGRQPSGADPAGGASATTFRPADPAAIRRSKFERLTAGVLDGIRPPHPARSEPGPMR
jgi:hypothetical protein